MPCYRIADTEIWLYDLVNDVFYPNTWWGSFTKWGDSSQYKDIQKVYLGSTLIRPTFKDLYQEVEYIQTTWTQWINTGIFASNSIQTETKIEVTTTSMNKPVFWWCWGNSWYTTSKQYHLTPYNYKWYYWLNNSEWNAGTYNNTVWTQYTLIYNNANNKISVNGSEIWNTTGTVWVPNSSLAISYRGSPWNTLYYWQFKYFYFKIYDKSTGIYVRDMIPCYRKADSVIWMYDIINDVFYTNSWTWTFTKWPDVN